MLHAQQKRHQRPDPAVAIGDLFGKSAGRSDEGVQLVDNAIGFDTGAVFGHPLAARQAGFALVAAARVDALGCDGRRLSVWSLISSIVRSKHSAFWNSVSSELRHLCCIA